MDIADMDAVMAMLQTSRGADAMAHDGVHPNSNHDRGAAVASPISPASVALLDFVLHWERRVG